MSTRLGYLVTHPIQYQAPLLRLLARQPEVELKAYFLSDMSTGQYFDSGFGRAIGWDVPLVEGYEHEFLESGHAGREPSRLRTLPIERALERDGIEVLWMHGWAYRTYLRALRHARGLNVKVLIRGESSLQPAGSPWKQPAKNAFLKWCFSRIDGFLPIGTLNRDFYRHHGVSDERLFDVPYAVDNDFFRSQVSLARPQREALRESLGLDPRRPVILFAGKLVPHKGAHDLLQAYTRLAAKAGSEPEPCLLFAGDGSERSALEASAQATGWSSIRFLGFRNQTELPAFFDLCDVFVLPSLFEPWGLIANEVMNAAKPIVISDACGCAPDLIQHGVNGLVFPAGDVTALADRLRTLSGNAALRTRMGVASCQRISKWSFQEDVDGLLRAVEAVRS